MQGGSKSDRGSLSSVRETISKNLDTFKEMSQEEVLSQRKNKFLNIGRGKGFTNNPESLSALEDSKNSIYDFLKNKKNMYYLSGSILLIIILVGFFL